MAEEDAVREYVFDNSVFLISKIDGGGLKIQAESGGVAAGVYVDEENGCFSLRLEGSEEMITGDPSIEAAVVEACRLVMSSYQERTKVNMTRELNLFYESRRAASDKRVHRSGSSI